MTFYKGKDGYLVRTKGGVSKNRINNDPAFARTRENGTEFGHSASMSKLLRQSISGLLSDAKDSRISSRLTQTMSRVKNQDLTSARGQRQVAIGLASPEGRAWLKGFDCNVDANLDSVLQTEYVVDVATGECTISDFVPTQQLRVPQGATHVTLSAAFLNLDFATGNRDLTLSNEENLPINGSLSNLTLTAAVPAGTGNQLYLLKVAFFQEMNGIQYPLNNGAYNALRIVEVQ
jgi:hypothetical protein